MGLTTIFLHKNHLNLLLYFQFLNVFVEEKFNFV